MFYEVPEFESIKSWREVPIKECGERLVSLNDLDPKNIFVGSEYFNKKIPGATKNQYLRESAAQRLLETVRILKEEFDPQFQLLIYDAFRPATVQSYIFNEEFKRVSSEHPDWSDEEVSQETQRFVSSPSTDPLAPAPHNTGGAVDLSIMKANIKLQLSPAKFDDTGTDYGKFAKTDFFETTEDPKEFIYRDNRRILYFAMTKAGFTNYPEEWWHFDYGNQFWGKIKGVDALYGVAPTL